MNSNVYGTTLMSAVAVASTGNAESAVANLKNVTDIEGVWVAGVPTSGNADLKVEYALSPDGTNYDAYGDRTALVAATATTYANNKNGYNFIAWPNSICGGQYVKFKVTGVNSNPASTKVTLILMLREGVH